MKVTKEMILDACVGNDIPVPGTTDESMEGKKYPVWCLTNALFLDGEVENVVAVKDGVNAIKRHLDQAIRIKTEKWIKAQTRIRDIQFRTDLVNPEIKNKPVWKDIQEAIEKEAKEQVSNITYFLLDNFDHTKVAGLVLPSRPGVVVDSKAKEQADLAAKRKQIFKPRRKA